MPDVDESAFDGDFRVQTDVYESITDEAEENPKQETGGMLFGSFDSTGDSLTVIVEKAVQIPSEAAQRTAAHFGIAPAYADRMLDEHCPKYVYLGNWHSHLNYGGPSQGDYQRVSQFFETNQNRDLMIAMIMDRQELRPPSFAPIAEVYTRDDAVSQGYRIARVDEVQLYDTRERHRPDHKLGTVLSELEVRQSLLDRLTEIITTIGQQTRLPVDDAANAVYINRGGVLDEVILCFPLEYETGSGEDIGLQRRASGSEADGDDTSGNSQHASTAEDTAERDGEDAEQPSESESIEVYLTVSVPLIYPDGDIYLDLASRNLTQQLTVGTYAAATVDASPGEFADELTDIADETIPSILAVPLSETIMSEIA